MPLFTILYITLAAIFALGFVFFAYFFKNKNLKRQTYFLSGARFISIFTLLILLINPQIKHLELETIKPELVLAIDRSKSIDNLEKTDSLLALIAHLQENKELNEKFHISAYNFGGALATAGNDSLQINTNKTDIYNALSQLSRLYKEKPTLISLFSDGNSTFGQDYEFLKPSENATFHTIVVGDTTTQVDLSIGALNVNKYAFLNNLFPVEIFLNYTGEDAINATFQLKEGNTIVYDKSFNFNKENSSEIINTTLTTKQVGTRIYEAHLTSSLKENNLINNKKQFAVEVIDERTKILMLSNILHPDLGALKKSIESNKQREVTLKRIKDFNISEINDFQLVIIYQPNKEFNEIFQELDIQKINRFIITGSKTDWNSLNNFQPNVSKTLSTQAQDVFPLYNDNFLQYQFEDIGFKDFPPLQDSFGSLIIKNENNHALLFQKIEGIETYQPLLSIFEDKDLKTGFLFGEHLWKWRFENYRKKGDFELIDNFWNQYIQYLSSTKKRDRLTYEAKSVYFQNEEIGITAQFFDKNYIFAPNAALNIFIKNLQTNETIETALLPDSNFYKIALDGLNVGEYEFIIKEKRSGINRKGRFSVLEYNIEQQFSAANFKKMEFLAKNNSGNSYLLKEEQKLIKDLIEDKRYVSVQKSHEKTVPLINWKYLLILLVLSLSAEWFTRKYFGLI